MTREKTWISGPPSLSPGAEALSLLYNERELSYGEIGQMLGVSKVTVGRWIRKAGIQPRSISDGTKIWAKDYELTEEHREKLRANAAIARTHITAESREKHRQKMIGRTPPNKGVLWTEQQRAKHMEIRRSAEYRQKLATANSGEKNYMWKGGPTDDRRRSDWKWRERAQECYERDGWICRRCGVHCTGKGPTRIQAHHLLPKRRGGSDELDNLVTLCVTCHAAAERLFKRRGPSGTKPTALATHKKRS